MTAAEECLLAESYLRDSRDLAGDPWPSMVDRVAKAERDLGEGLRQFAKNGPPDVLSARTQYTIGFSDQQPPDSLGAAIKRLDDVNHTLVGLLAQQAEKAGFEELKEDTEQLRQKVEAVARQISLIRVSSEDV